MGEKLAFLVRNMSALFHVSLVFPVDEMGVASVAIMSLANDSLQIINEAI